MHFCLRYLLSQKRLQVAVKGAVQDSGEWSSRRVLAVYENRWGSRLLRVYRRLEVTYEAGVGNGKRVCLLYPGAPPQPDAFLRVE